MHLGTEAAPRAYEDFGSRGHVQVLPGFALKIPVPRYTRSSWITVPEAGAGPQQCERSPGRPQCTMAQWSPTTYRTSQGLPKLSSSSCLSHCPSLPHTPITKQESIKAPTKTAVSHNAGFVSWPRKDILLTSDTESARWNAKPIQTTTKANNSRRNIYIIQWWLVLTKILPDRTLCNQIMLLPALSARDRTICKD